MKEIHSTRNRPVPSAAVARLVMEDVAEWWVRVLLRDFNVDRFHSCLETVLPHISPVSASSTLAAQFRLLSLWEEVLLNTHFEGDFAMLRDKLLLLSTYFQRSVEFDTCMELLKVHELLGRLYTTLTSRAISPSSANDVLRQGLERFRQSLSVIYLGTDVPDELSYLMTVSVVDVDISSILNDLESLVASNAESTLFGYDTLRDRMQALLLNWVETEFDTPTLVRLGYRINDPSIQEGKLGEQTISFPPRQDTGRASHIVVSTTVGNNDDDSAPTAETEDDDARPLLLTQQFSTTEHPVTKESKNTDLVHDSETTELVPAQQNNTWNGSDDEEETDVAAVAMSKRKLRSHKVLVPLSKSRSKSHSPVPKQPRIQRENRSPNFPLPIVHGGTGDVEHDPGSRRRRQPSNSSDAGRYHGTLSPTERVFLPQRITLPSPTRRTEGHERDRNRMKLLRNRLAALGTQRRSGDASTTLTWKRRPFTSEETNAIIDGVLKYGNDWATIKSISYEVLESRSIINIQDHARLLMKRGKIDPASLKRHPNRSFGEDNDPL